MLTGSKAPLRIAERLLKGLIALNIVYGTGILAMLATSLLAPQLFFTAVGVQRVGGDGATVVGMRLIMVFGLASVPINHVVLARLRAIVCTVQVGDPFITENAERLRLIAWAVLGLELIHLLIGALVAASSSSTQSLDIHWSFSFTPWLAVVLLFVLAQVFDWGSRMRADLDGTV